MAAAVMAAPEAEAMLGMEGGSLAKLFAGGGGMPSMPQMGTANMQSSHKALIWVIAIIIIGIIAIVFMIELRKYYTGYCNACSPSSLVDSCSFKKYY